MPSTAIFYLLVFLVLLVAPAGLILFVLVLLENGRGVWRHFSAAVKPMASALAGSPLGMTVRRRYPRTISVVVGRLNPDAPWGLPATVAGGVILVGTYIFLGVLQDLFAKDPLVLLDLRLHNSVPLFRTEGMTRFMLVVTELGGAPALSLLCVGMALLALARGRPRLAATFLLALTIPAVVSFSLKALVGNARPFDAIVSAQEGSFPSGHLLSATVIYGLIATQLLQSAARNAFRAAGVALLLFTIVLVGLSRLYLGVHWPSDLLGSLAIALVLLSSLLFFLHYGRSIPWLDDLKLPVRLSVLHSAGFCALILAVYVVAAFSALAKLVVPEIPVPSRPWSIERLRTTLPNDVPHWSEDLIGNRLEPVSLVLVGSEARVFDAFKRAGWARADPPTPARALEEGMAALRDLPDPTAPATPTYLMDRPQDLTFEKSDGATPSIRRRHHTRLWSTNYCVEPGCRRIWLATASFDSGMELSRRFYFPTHHIDADVDQERALIAGDLVRMGASQEAVIDISPRMSGANAAGDPFRTDGRAVVLSIP